MNKVYNINLGGLPFVIDDEAYNELGAYLGAIERHFSTSEGCDEIMGDIEARISELFTEKKQAIIGMRNVEEIVKIMGTPEEFGATSSTYDHAYARADHHEDHDQHRIRTGKRLFRDPDDKKIAGVCSGLAAYFGIEDPVWLRIIAIALLFTGGLSVPLYVLMWVLLPEALTASDKLQMRGEATNISNIGKIIEEEVDNLTDTVSEFGKGFKSKKKVAEHPLFHRYTPLRRGYLL